MMDHSPRPPVRPISRVQLIGLLTIIPLFFLGCVSWMWLASKPSPEPILIAKVRQEVTVHTPRRSPDSPRILPCLIIENPTTDSWRNVAISINKEFFFYPPGTLSPEQNITVPLEFFVTKGGNVAFQPGSESVHRVTIFAQIPTGARAVSENYFDKKGNPIEKP